MLNESLNTVLLSGVPYLPEELRKWWRGGRVIWVDSTETSRGDGSFARPFKAVFGTAGALASIKNKTKNGALIVCKPGHTENVSAADMGSDMGTASGFTIASLGKGPMRATFTWTAAAATFLLDTDGVELVNLRMFWAGAHAAGSALTVAAPITVSGNGCAIENCDIWMGFDADQIVNQGLIVTGDDFRLRNNWMFAEAAAVPTATFVTLTGADRAIIEGNWIKGATSGTTVGVIRGLTTESLNIIVRNNYMANVKASSTIAFSPLASSTGEISGNKFFVNSGILPVTASIGEWYENYVINGAGEAGALVGTPSA